MFKQTPVKLLVKVVIIIVLLSTLGCADSKTLTLNGKTTTFEPYGLIDEDELKNDSIQYKANTGNVIWSVIGFETIAIPVWLVGYQLYEPIGIKRQYQSMDTTTSKISWDERK